MFKLNKYQYLGESERRKRVAYKSGTGVFNNLHQSGQSTLKMSPGSCPLVKVSGEMFTPLDNQGQVMKDFDTLVRAQIHMHAESCTHTHAHTQTERR